MSLPSIVYVFPFSAVILYVTEALFVGSITVVSIAISTSAEMWSDEKSIFWIEEKST